jgi:hypothetical protein
MNNMQIVNTQEIRRCDNLSVAPTIYRRGSTKPEFTIHESSEYEQGLKFQINPILLNKNSSDPYETVPVVADEQDDLLLRDSLGYLARIPFNKIAKIECVDKSGNASKFKIFLKNGFEMFFNALGNFPNHGEWEVRRTTKRKFHLIRHDLCLVN